jgi:hypothetical protein
MPSGFGANRISNAVRRHYQMVKDAIGTRDMRRVERANEQGWRQEQSDIKSYGARR